MDRAGVVPQLLGAAVGIVVGSVVLFAVVGAVRDGGDEPTPEIAASPSDPAPTDGESTPAATATEAAPSASDEPAEEPAPTETTSEAPAEEPTEEATASEPPPADVDPASVSIQVLDAIGGDGGSAAANAVADELREAGYDVVVVNRAGRSYDVTTVFWSEGQSDGGRQVAAALGTDQAEQTPDEVQLSNAVDVHVVVGADRA